MGVSHLFNSNIKAQNTKQFVVSAFKSVSTEEVNKSDGGGGG